MTDFFIDFTASGGGNGSAATPWNSFASISGLAAGDKIWLRRVSLTISTQASGILTNVPSGCFLIGWPKVGDTYYSTRPAAPRTVWDADAGDYASIVHNPPAAGAATQVDRVTLAITLTAAYTIYMGRVSIKRYQQSGISDSCIFGVYEPATGWQTANTRSYTTENCYLGVYVGGKTGGGLNVFIVYFAASGTTAGTAISWTDTGSTLEGESSASVSVGSNVIYVTGYTGANNYVNLSLKLTKTVLLSRQSTLSDTSYWFYPVSPYSYVSGFFDRCSFIRTMPTASLSSVTYSIVPPTNGLVYNKCSFSQPAGSAPGYGRYSADYGLYNDCSFTGFNSVLVTNGTVSMSIASLSAGGPDSSQATISVAGADAGLLRAMNVSSNASTRDTQGTSAVVGSGLRLFRGCNFMGLGHLVTPNTTVIHRDQYGQPGSYTVSSPEGMSRVSPVSRVGGALHSVELRASGSEGVYSDEPGRDSIRAAIKQGSSTLRMYGACASGLAVDTNTVWIEVEVPSAAGHVVYSSRTYPATAITSDSSTWNGLSGDLTPFQLVLPLTLSIPSVALIRVATTSFGPIYIDPRPAIT